MTRSRFAFVASVLALSACGPSGTYVVLNFTSGPATASSIHCDFTLGGKAATSDFAAKSGTFTFPTKGSVEVGSGSGMLGITCEARDAAGTVLASSMMRGIDVVRDQSVTIDIAFGPASGDDGGIKPTGVLTIAPATHNYGVTLVDTMSPPQTFVVTNTGDAPTGSLQVLLMADAGMDYAITGGTCAAKALAAKDTCTINVVFAPKSAGLTKHALVQVTAPDGTPGGTASASLDGSAGAKGDLRFDKDISNFGGVGLGNTSPSTTLTLTNAGGGPTTQISVSLSGSNAASFTKSADGCDGTVLPAGGTCTITVAFAPSARGDLSASLSATATKGGTAVSNLTGRGQVAAQLVIMGNAPQSAPFNLGTVDVGSTGTVAHHFTVKKAGDFATGALAIDTIPLNSEAQPTALTTCAAGMVLNPGDSCVGDLVLKPSSFGAKSVQVNFSATPGGNVSTNVVGVGQDYITIQAAVVGGNGATGVVSDTAQPQNFNCGGGGTACTKTFARNTMVPMVAMGATPDAATSSLMDKWVVSGANSPPCQEGNPDTTTTCSLNLGTGVPANTAAAPYVYTANFKKQLFTITYQRSDADYIAGNFGGDTVGLGLLSSSNGFTCAKAPCVNFTESIPAGTSLTITAKARTVAGQSTLRRILAPCTSGTSYASGNSDATCTFTVNADVTVNANFSAHNYAFVTNAQFDGNLGGIAGANTKCQAAATAAKIPGTFIAILSDSVTDMRDRIGAATNGWIRIDGLPFATDKASLFAIGAPANSYRVYYPLSMSETGTVFTAGEYTRTFTSQDGTKHGATDHCVNWTSSTDAGTTQQFMGVVTTGSVAWTNGAGLGAGCGAVAKLSCMGTDLNTPVTNLPLPSIFKRIFMSSGKFTPSASGKRADMDTICNNEGMAGLGKPFKALVATTTTTAASQAAAGAYVFVRPDNVQVGSSVNVLGALAPLKAPITQFADGTYPAFYDGQGWVGSASPNALGTAAETCTNWSDSTGMMARIATTFETSSSWWNWINGVSCNSARRVYCVEQ